MNAAPSSPRLGEILSGWRTLLGSTLGSSVGVHALPFYTSGLFMVALQADKGWSRSAISLGTTLFAIGLGVAAPVIGALCDRFGERRIIVPGLVIQVAALIALSRIDTLTSFYLAMGGMALLGAGCGALPYARIVNSRFHLSKGTALGLMITGTAGLSALAPVVIQAVILSYGWRVGYLTHAAVIIIIAPVALMLLRSGRNVAVARETVVPVPLNYVRLVRDRTFQLLVVAILSAALAAPGIITHLAAMLKDDGISAETGALLLGLVGLTQAIARLGTGLLADRFFAPKVAAVIFSISGLGFAIFGAVGAPAAVIGAIAAGLAYGAEADLLGYLVGRYFRQAHFGRIFGVLVCVFLAGAALSPLWYGWSADYFGHYHIGLAGASAVLFLSAIVFCLMPPFPRNETSDKA
ncbi:MFS transporter [Niveispirillum sp.]|uniref:MFS transporter n=1 Tax=Niveispirillum sp. TaxID=1917217 RepID=UPI001B5E5D5E|nr:MFS transporter [Niveispirillum sp.]MBP7337900.1 MFS transporter [Niveispirillum sp.]